MSGNTPLFNEAGRYGGPTGKIGFWFNLTPGGSEGIYFSGARPRYNNRAPVIHLGEADVKGECSYRVTFTVPNVPPGRYNIVPIEHGQGGASSFGAIEFHVTA